MLFNMSLMVLFFEVAFVLNPRLLRIFRLWSMSPVRVLDLEAGGVTALNSGEVRAYAFDPSVVAPVPLRPPTLRLDSEGDALP